MPHQAQVIKALKSAKNQIRVQAEQDLESFISLVHPQRLSGGLHIELISWWNRSKDKSHQLVLLPGDHGKSAISLISSLLTLLLTRLRRSCDN